MQRSDLMELGVEALTALANPGFVKRAQKDVAAGALPGLRQEPDGTVHALFDDGTETSMAPGVPLRDATCNCSASGMCRHRVMLVLAYQAGRTGAGATPDSMPPGWSPASFDDAVIAAAVTPQVLEQARRLAGERPVATVMLAGAANSVPAAYLPMSQVRFFSSASLAHARCDCQLGNGCAHVVLACWAFRQAQYMDGASEATLEIAPFGAVLPIAPEALMASEAALRVRADAGDWLWSLWREGAAQPLPGLESRYEALQADLAQLGWTWVAEDLATTWRIVQSLARRSSRFGMDDLLDDAARLHARLAGAAHADGRLGARIPASQVLGIGQQGEVALDLLRLVSLGMTCWRDDASEGASIVFADPDTQATCVLERAWPRSDSASGDVEQLLNRRIAGLPLRQLAAGQVVTRAARRRANGHVELGAQARQTNALALSPKAWDDLRAPIRFATLDALLHHLQGRPPAGIGSGETASNWHVVDLHGLALDHWAWDGARQTLFAEWHAASHLTLRARLAYEGMQPGAVDALARALDGEWGDVLAIAGPAWREQGGVAMQPVSLLTQQRAVVLALAPKAPQAMALSDMPLAADAGATLLHAARHVLGQILRQGLRHAPPALRTRTLALAAQLGAAGYTQAGALLHGAFAEQRGAAGVAALSALSLLLGALLA